MTAAKLRKGKKQSSLQGNISKDAVVKKPPKILGGQRKKISVEKDVSAQFGITTPAECHSNKGSSPGRANKRHFDINQRPQDMHCSSKIKLQLFPFDEKLRAALEKDGHYPFLELTLSARKRISSVVTHLSSKWGSSSIAMGELMLFPFDVVAENFTAFRRWSSSDNDIRAAEVHSAVGSPEVFRLRYAWVSSVRKSSASHLVTRPAENVSSHVKEPAYGADNQAETKSKGVKVCYMNGSTNEIVKQTASSEPPNLVVHVDQGAPISESLKPSMTIGTKTAIAVEESSSDKSGSREAERMDREHHQPPAAQLLMSDLSNISIGGLLSEASLQGIFNTPAMKSGSSRSTALPAASANDSLDAFIDHLNSFNTSTAHTSGVPSSILDAEDTCHSFAFSKLSSKDPLILGRGAFSGLSSQDAAFRPFRCPKPEGNVQKGAAGISVVPEPIAEPLPSSAGFYNNENSLGLSSIRWNDSLGPFDLQRQITKDDSISMGGFVR